MTRLRRRKSHADGITIRRSGRAAFSTLSVRSGKALTEQMSSGSPPKADVGRRGWHIRLGPTPDVADVQTREYWRCRPSLATHFCFGPIARNAPASEKLGGVAS